MASTNKTQYFELSQYISSDKPTYLVDYNGDMQKIDTALHTAQSNSSEAVSSVGDLTTLTTTNKASTVGAINEVNGKVTTNTSNIGTNTNDISAINGKIGTMANLTTAEKSNIVGAVNEVNAKAIQNGTNIDKLNLNTFVTHNETTVSISSGRFNYCELSEASNSDGSLGKLYGIADINLSGVASGTNIAVSYQTNLRPSSNININMLGITIYIGNQINAIYNLNVSINTNGVVTFNVTSDGSNGVIRCILFPCLLFMKDFGDVNNQ